MTALDAGLREIGITRADLEFTSDEDRAAFDAQFGA
jgi:hypothetical protein